MPPFGIGDLGVEQAGMSRLVRMLLIGLFLGVILSAGGRTRHVSPERDTGSQPETEETDDFVYEVIARTNEGVVSNIDTADLALLAVLAAIATIIVFGIDKIRELKPPWEGIAYVLLAASAACCVVGYLIGLFKVREPVDPRRFLIDFAQDPEETRATATLGTVRAYYINKTDRKRKRLLVGAALACLVVGTIIIAVARSSAGVV